MLVRQSSEKNRPNNNLNWGLKYMHFIAHCTYVIIFLNVLDIPNSAWLALPPSPLAHTLYHSPVLGDQRLFMHRFNISTIIHVTLTTFPKCSAPLSSCIAEDVILLGCCGCHTLGLLRMSYLGAAENVILQLLHFVDLDINLVSEVPGLLHLLEKLLHVTCEIVQNITQ